MSELTNLNMSPEAASLINGRSISNRDIMKRKCMYLEGLIRFMEIYAQTEIGECDVDIRKCALYVNSPIFENTVCFSVKTMNQVYKSLEMDAIKGVPLYRFLKLSESQMSIFERSHHSEIASEFDRDCDKHICLKCIWLNVGTTSFGVYSSCNRPNPLGAIHRFRDGYHHYEKVHKCKWLCTAYDDIPDWVLKSDLGGRSPRSDEKTNSYEHQQRRWIDKYNHLDNSVIPAYVDSEDFVDLKSPDDQIAKIADNLAGILSGRQSPADIRKKLKIAILIECMIRFIEIYAQNEIGSDYQADISKIAKYVLKHQYSDQDRLFDFSSYDEAYSDIEESIIDGFDVSKFIKRRTV